MWHAHWHCSLIMYWYSFWAPYPVGLCRADFRRNCCIPIQNPTVCVLVCLCWFALTTIWLLCACFYTAPKFFFFHLKKLGPSQVECDSCHYEMTCCTLHTWCFDLWTVAYYNSQVTIMLHLMVLLIDFFPPSQDHTPAFLLSRDMHMVTCV